MKVKCTQVSIGEDGRIACDVIVKNDTSDTDAIKQISLTRTRRSRVKSEEDNGESEAIIASTPQVAVELSPGVRWEKILTWDEDALNKVTQQRTAMVLVTFANAKPVGAAFTVPDIQRGKSATSNFQKLVQKAGWPLISLAILSGVLSIIRMNDMRQQREEIAESMNSIPAERVRAILEELAAETDSEPGTESTGGDNNEMPALMEASLHGHIKDVKRLLDEGADVNALYDEANALYLASLQGYSDIAKLLLDKGADVDIRVNTETPLMRASWEGNTDIVKLLLDQDAVVNVKDDGGGTALISASFQGHTDIVKLLLGKGADVNVKNNDGWTALIFASMQAHADIVKLLLDKGVDVNAKDSNGMTALMHVPEDRADIVTLLQSR